MIKKKKLSNARLEKKKIKIVFRDRPVLVAFTVTRYFSSQRGGKYKSSWKPTEEC